MRLPWTAFAVRAVFSVADKSVPHTRQRAASTLTRVPHVGHILVCLDGFSGLIWFFIYQHAVRPNESCTGCRLRRLYHLPARVKGKSTWYTPAIMVSYSIYIHIPFCSHRCGYCDFNTYAGLEDLIAPYTQALCAEIEYIATSSPPLPAHTIFFGGGTPSLLPAAEVKRILLALSKAFDFSPLIEISLEANPGTLSLSYLQELRQLGINRLSLGVQSANPAELRLLERQHNYTDVIQAAGWARQAGFDNLNLDLIYGLPDQSLESWQRTLDLAIGLHPEHFSLYALTLEHGTPFGRWAARGLISEPDPDLAADMYEWAAQRLSLAGYDQYEISNWACRRNGQLLACRHNLQYWRGLPYLGLGAGAHGYAASQRTVNVLAPQAYIQRCLHSVERDAHRFTFPQTPATLSVSPINRQSEIGEMMMMGLRLTDEGVSAVKFLERFGQTLDQVYGPQIERLIRLGLLEWAGPQEDSLRLSQRGRLLGNQVFMEFI
jgi:oxygen-independent coproporphyrinogen III oxidase